MSNPFYATDVDDQNLIFDDLISPTNALFPELSLPYNDASYLSIPAQLNHRQSISASSDGRLSWPSALNSRLPSLSPSSQAMSAFHSNHSPHSSGSPSSNFSMPVADDSLFNDSFSSGDLDLFFAQDYQHNTFDQQNTQGLFLPGNFFSQQIDPAKPADNTLPYLKDERYDLLNLEAADGRRFSTTSNVPNNGFDVTPAMNAVPSLQQNVFSNMQVFPPQWTTQVNQPLNNWSPTVQPGMISTTPEGPLPAPPPGRPRQYKKRDVSSPLPGVGKHNKTERRYRQKVQAAQADLRDSVPALRLLYGTSSEDQRRTTDIRAADGTVDGLGEFNRPNASAKTTIFLGARLYIELLQRRVATLHRKVNELEGYRLAVGGGTDLQQWQLDFDGREAVIAAARVTAEEESYDEADEEDEPEEEEPKRKKPKTAPKMTKGKTKNVDVPTSGGSGVRVFAAFAMSFSLLPSASTLFKSAPIQVQAEHGVEVVSIGQVISRLPLITAEHTTRLLARSLPSAVVPHPHTLVDWTWRLLVAAVLMLLLGPVMRRFTRSSKLTNSWLQMSSKRNLTESGTRTLTAYAAGILGGATTSTLLNRQFTTIRMHWTAIDAYSLALLALLQSRTSVFASPVDTWQSAQDQLNVDSPSALKAVLGLPVEEAIRALALAPRTASPIAAIAEQISLVHLHDVLSRLFVHLVEATSPASGDLPVSASSLFENLRASNLGEDLKATVLDKEIREIVFGVPKGSTAHALGLVVIGLWGILTGPSPSAQAAIASALAAAEVKGVGAGLPSTSAMLELLFPGSSDRSEPTLVANLPTNAFAVDRLALICVGYINLLSSVPKNHERKSRAQRLEASQKMQQSTIHLRTIMTQITFRGFADVSGQSVCDHAFGEAKERFVGVLSVVGRRAAGRAVGRDEDSGLEGDLDEL